MLRSSEKARVRQARDYAFFSGVFGWAIVILFRTVGMWNPAVPLFRHWWSPILSGIVTGLYLIAGWGMGRRERWAAVLGLALFSWRVVAGFIAGHPLTLSMIMGLLGIVLVLPAAKPLGLSVSRPVA